MRSVRKDQRRTLILSILVLGLAITWAGGYGMVRRTRNAAEAAGIADTTTLARLLAAEWSHTLVHIAGLQHVAAIVTREMQAGRDASNAILELRQSLAISEEYIVQVASIGADGFLQWSNVSVPSTPIDLSEREHFRAIAVDGRDSFIGSPVLGKVSGKRTIQMAVAVRRPDRTLDAVTVVSIDAAILRQTARAINVDGRGVIAIFRTDGTLVARDQETPPLSIRMRPDFLQKILTEGHFEETHVSRTNGKRRFYAFVRVHNSDMIVDVGLDADIVLAPMYIAIRQIQLLAGILSMVLILLAAAADFGMRRSSSLIRERLRHVAVREREALLRQLADEATDVISMHDASFNYIYVNPAIRHLVGAATAPNMGEPAFCQALPDDRRLIDDALAELEPAGGSRRVSFRIRREDGALRWLETELIRVGGKKDLAGTGVCYVAISRDITSRKEVEASLVEAKINLEALLRGSGGMLYGIRTLAGHEPAIRIIGSQDNRFFEFGPDTLANPGFLHSRFNPEGQAEWDEMSKTCLQDGNDVIEIELRNGNDKWRWLRVIGYRFTEEAGPVELLFFITDVTDERRIRMQTERLAVLGEVSAGISHELNQPLSIIAMAAQNGERLLQKGPDNAALAIAKFQRIEQHVMRADKIIRHIRNFGRRDLAIGETFDVTEVISDAIVLAHSRLSVAAIDVSVNVGPGLPKLHSTRLLVEQLLMNLMINASDAYLDNPVFQNPAMKRPLDMTAEADGAWCLLRVSDKAGGIAPEAMEQIFQPFFTSKVSGKGTGLGLAFCTTAAAQMGGRITARNENGGAVFEIRLPGLVMDSEVDPAVDAVRASPLPGRP